MLDSCPPPRCSPPCRARPQPAARHPQIPPKPTNRRAPGQYGTARQAGGACGAAAAAAPPLLWLLRHVLLRIRVSALFLSPPVDRRTPGGTGEGEWPFTSYGRVSRSGRGQSSARTWTGLRCFSGSASGSCPVEDVGDDPGGIDSAGVGQVEGVGDVARTDRRPGHRLTPGGPPRAGRPASDVALPLVGMHHIHIGRADESDPVAELDLVVQVFSLHHVVQCDVGRRRLEV